MKFILFVEGATEKKGAAPFIQRWLNSKLQPATVGIKPIDLKGWGNFVKEVPGKARLHLKSERDEIIAAIGLMDLYGAGFIPENLSSAQEKYDWGKRKIEKDVNHDKFRMFFAVHEVEAWILSRPDLLPFLVSGRIAQRLAKPEEVDFDEHPAKLLKKLYAQAKKGGYKKTVDGEQLFSKLDPEAVFDKCPYFQAMVEEMLNLAQEALS
jgi:hypothetical protein